MSGWGVHFRDALDEWSPEHILLRPKVAGIVAQSQGQEGFTVRTLFSASRERSYALNKK